jgi:hypothetical protein
MSATSLRLRLTVRFNCVTRYADWLLTKLQVPDFQFFHGLGTLLIHYPLFELFGENLFAPELSREVISPCSSC